MRDPWSALGIARGASRQQIKEAYRAMAKKYHPDLCDEAVRAEAEVQFKLINEARMQLLSSHGGSWRTQTSGSTTAAAAASRAWQGGGADEHHGPFSNGLLAAVIALPLILTGAWMGRTMPNNVERTWRRHGLMQPPVNPWLREDLQPKTKSHGWGFVDWPSRGDPQPSV